jgi:hypothetical protein
MVVREIDRKPAQLGCFISAQGQAVPLQVRMQSSWFALWHGQIFNPNQIEWAVSVTDHGLTNMRRI